MTPAETTAQIETYAQWHARVFAAIEQTADAREPFEARGIENHDVREPDDHLSHGEQAGLDKRRSAAMYGGAL